MYLYAFNRSFFLEILPRKHTAHALLVLIISTLSFFLFEIYHTLCILEIEEIVYYYRPAFLVIYLLVLMYLYTVSLSL